MLKRETNHIAASPGIDHIDEIAMLGDCDRLASARTLSVDQSENRSVHAKHRNLPASRVYRKQPLTVRAQRQRALRFQRIRKAAAPSSACCKPPPFLQSTVFRPHKRNHLVLL